MINHVLELASCFNFTAKISGCSAWCKLYHSLLCITSNCRPLQSTKEPSWWVDVTFKEPWKGSTPGSETLQLSHLPQARAWCRKEGDLANSRRLAMPKPLPHLLRQVLAQLAVCAACYAVHRHLAKPRRESGVQALVLAEARIIFAY